MSFIITLCRSRRSNNRTTHIFQYCPSNSSSHPIYPLLSITTQHHHCTPPQLQSWTESTWPITTILLSTSLSPMLKAISSTCWHKNRSWQSSRGWTWSSRPLRILGQMPMVSTSIWVTTTSQTAWKREWCHRRPLRIWLPPISFLPWTTPTQGLS